MGLFELSLEEYKQTITPLTESISHWADIRAGKPEWGMGRRKCALCRVWNNAYPTPQDGACLGCIVERVTGRLFCGGTPYQEFEKHMVWCNKCRMGGQLCPEGEKLAGAEFDFLADILSRLRVRQEVCKEVCEEPEFRVGDNVSIREDSEWAGQIPLTGGNRGKICEVVMERGYNVRFGSGYIGGYGEEDLLHTPPTPTSPSDLTREEALTECSVKWGHLGSPMAHLWAEYTSADGERKREYRCGYFKIESSGTECLHRVSIVMGTGSTYREALANSANWREESGRD